ncbi:MarR family winged helix-turn-helix transcriptional regulator [Puia sp.]|uniref:MarR family winged helix-turn-helix transcriptional regulator n=1 Tax=Puia sp. TaxID=2045100 RepID=UPI002F41EBC3
MITSFQLSRLIGRIATIQRTLLRLALRESPGIEPEWYYFLHSIADRSEVRKTDIISYRLILEPTTGIDILNRMIRAGLLEERPDPQDGRARLLRLTKKGTSTLNKAQQQAQKIAHLLYGDDSMPPTINMLEEIEKTFSRILTEQKPRTFSQLTSAL